MTTIDIGDVIRIVAEWDGPGGMLAQMVWHYRGKSGTAAPFATVGAAIVTAIEAAWLHIDQDLDSQLIASTQEMLQWDFTLNRWDGVDSRPYAALDGLTIGDIVGHGIAGLGKIFTAAARRQARKYVPGFIKTETGDSILNPDTLTNLGLFLLDFDDDVVAGGLTLEFGTFNTDPVSPLFETFSAAIGTVQAESVLSYQRRRRPGTGI